MLYLYLSDGEIAVIQTSKGLVGKEKIIASSRKQIPAGIITDGLIANPQLLVTELSEVFSHGYPKELKDKEVSLVISDKQVFTKILKIAPTDKGTDISSLVIEEAKKVLSQDIGELVNFYKPLNPTEPTSDIFYTAIPKATVLHLAKFMKTNGLRLNFLAASSQAIFQILKPLIGSGEVWFYADLDKENEKVEYFTFDNLGLINHMWEKLGNKSVVTKTKSLLEHLEKEKGKTITKLIVGGAGSIDLLVSELSETVKISIGKMGEIIDEAVKATNLEFDTGGIPKVLFAYPLGLMLLAKTASPANFAADMKSFADEELTPVSIPAVKDEVSEVTKEEKIEEKKPVEKKVFTPTDNTQMMPGQIVEYKKVSIGQIFTNKIFLIIVSVLAGFIVIGGLLSIFGKKGNITFPFMVSPSPTPTPTIVPTLTPTPTIDVKLKRSDLTVSVQNGTDKTGFAKEIATYLEGKGYKNVAKGNADKDNYEKTIIKIKKAKENYLPLLVNDLSGKVDTSTTETFEETSQYDAIVILGQK